MIEFRTRHATIAGVAAGIVLAVVPAAAAPQTKAQTDADVQEVASYRLTVENVRKAAGVMRSVAEEAKKDPRYQDLAKIKSELDALQAKDEPTDAEVARIEELSTRREQLEAQLEHKGLSGSDDGSLTDMAASLEREPIVARALAKGGMSAREFSKFILAMFQASFAASLQKAGTIKELPKDINAENVKFVLEHEAELQQLQEEMKALGTEK